MPALGLLSTEHLPHGPHSWVTPNDCLGLGSFPPAASLRKPLGGPSFATYGSMLGFSSATPTSLSLILGDSGADQAPLLHWLPGSSEPNGI